MEPFILNQTANVPYFSLSHWESRFPNLTVGFSARRDDFHWKTSNYGMHIVNQNVQYQQVIENREKLAGELGMKLASWTSGKQVHGTQIAVVTKGDRGNGCTSQENAFPDTDGLITSEPDILLTTYYADCVPVYFYSSDTDMIGTVHAGWKGTVGNIVHKAVEKFISCGANKENIFAAIGPSISRCCYLVNETVVNPLSLIVSDENVFRTMIEEQCLNRWRLDLKQANKILLQQAGVLEEHISVSSWCTSCNPAYFHSHRRDAGNAGRMVAWIGKRERI